MCAHCLLSFHQIPLRQLSRFPWIFNLIFEQDGKIGWQEHHEAERKEMQCPAPWGGITRTHGGANLQLCGGGPEGSAGPWGEPELLLWPCLAWWGSGTGASPQHCGGHGRHGEYSELQGPRRDWASALRKGWGSWHCCLLKGRLGAVINVEQCLPRGGVKTDPGSSH